MIREAQQEARREANEHVDANQEKGQSESKGIEAKVTAKAMPRPKTTEDEKKRTTMFDVKTVPSGAEPLRPSSRPSKQSEEAASSTATGSLTTQRSSPDREPGESASSEKGASS